MKKKVRVLHELQGHYMELIIIITLFMLASYIVKTNVDTIESYITSGFLGMLLYVLLTVVAVVVAPISATPLLPIASNLWGWVVGALLSIVGWTIGAYIAFKVARVYGVPIVKKIVPLKRIRNVEHYIPKENIFWSVVFFRMVLPVDILSYALGLFSKMNTRDYVLATIIGVAPFAFVLAYIGKLPILLQIPVLVFALAFLIGSYFFTKKVKKKIKERNKAAK